MFSFLKDKLKKAISNISKKIEEAPQKEEKLEVIKEQFEEKAEIKGEAKPKEKESHKKEKKVGQIVEKVKEELEVKEPEEKKPVVEEKKGFFSKIKEKFSKTEVEELKPVENLEEIKEEAAPEKTEIKTEPEEKKGFFGKITEKITTTKISNDKFEELFSDLEMTLLENNVALEVIDKIKDDLKKSVVDKPIKRGKVEDEITNGLRESIEDLFLTPKINLIEKIREKNEKPFVICFVGQNGSGKTTSIAKIAHLLKKNNISVVLSASDTFRAASIHQIKEWGEKLNVKVIAHDYGSDPAAVSFDAISYAKAHKVDVVLIDTAGRQHSNKDLMRELEKVIRVAKPDLNLFVGEAITGNDCVEQSKEFNQHIGIDGIILTKADIDEKGGAIISTSYVIHRPIIYLGVGQSTNDLEEFDPEKLISSLGL